MSTPEHNELSQAVHRLAISESGFVFDPLSGQSFTVNPVGLEILRAMQKASSIEATKQFVQERFSGDAQEMERDLEDFLSNLSEQLGVS